MMQKIVELPVMDWQFAADPMQQKSALDALENGSVLLLPQLPFRLSPEEKALLTSVEGSAKNIGWDPARGVRGNDGATRRDPAALQAMLGRYAASTQSLLQAPAAGLSRCAATGQDHLPAGRDQRPQDLVAQG